MNYLIWKGKDSRNIKGLVICELPPITKPQMRIAETTINGKDGSMIEELGYASYDKTLSIGLTRDANIDEVMQYFTGDGEVVFSNEADKYYRGVIVKQIDYARLVRFRKANVVFRVQPFKYEYKEEVLTVTSNNVFDRSSEKTNTYIGEDGKEITSSDNTFIKQEIMPNSNKYVMFYKSKYGNPYVRLSYYNGNTFISSQTSSVAGYAFTVPSNCTKIDIRVDADTDYFVNLQIEAGAVPTICVPTNSGNYFAKPIIEIKGLGTIEFAVNGNTYFQYTFPDGEDTVIIDSEKQDAYLGTVLKNRNMIGEFPIFGVGTNQITWDGLIHEITISSKSRWL